MRELLLNLFRILIITVVAAVSAYCARCYYEGFLTEQ